MAALRHLSTRDLHLLSIHAARWGRAWDVRFSCSERGAFKARRALGRIFMRPHRGSAWLDQENVSPCTPTRFFQVLLARTGREPSEDLENQTDVAPKCEAI